MSLATFLLFANLPAEIQIIIYRVAIAVTQGLCLIDPRLGHVFWLTNWAIAHSMNDFSKTICNRILSDWIFCLSESELESRGVDAIRRRI